MNELTATDVTEVRTIHCIAIGGTGMAPLACLLKQKGYQVRGSDAPLYPPMSDLLAAAGIEPLVGFSAEHLDPEPDLVIVGNAVPRDNPEAVETERRGIERISMPQALARFCLPGRDSLVVTGTHGKTTTTTMAAVVYERCGHDPGYLIGGVPLDLSSSFALGSGRRFVIEGDEYNAAYFDRGPKFLHYRPETVILTGVEHDHADLYPDAESFRNAFAALIDLIPQNGLLVADGDSPDVRRLAQTSRAPVLFYGLGAGNDVRPTGAVDRTAEHSRCTVVDPGGGAAELELRVPGDHNLRNALAVWTVARCDGLPADAVLTALRGFRGARRRLEVLLDEGSAGVAVVDDFAHHPTEIQSSLEALRQRFPARRLVCAFEPRSLTAGREFLYRGYADAFAVADVVHLAPVFHLGRLQGEERLDFDRLGEELRAAGTELLRHHDVASLAAAVLTAARPGDVVVTMSSGSFERLPQRLARDLSDGSARSAEG